jgi:hypothetical protein
LELMRLMRFHKWRLKKLFCKMHPLPFATDLFVFFAP